MFIVKSAYLFNSPLDGASLAKLAPIVEVLPNFTEIVKENMLWGIFSKEDIFSLPQKLSKDHPFKPRGDYNNIFNLSYEFIEQAKAQVKEKFSIENPMFFVPEVEATIIGKQISANVEYEDCDVKVNNLLDSQTYFNKNEVEVIIAPTLPDCYVVFGALINGNCFEPTNTWVLPYMDSYEEWRREVMHELYNYYIQIGGHGRWIQNDYNGTYIAQVNNDIGDGGSIFIMASNGDIQGYVDMH